MLKIWIRALFSCKLYGANYLYIWFFNNWLTLSVFWRTNPLKQTWLQCPLVSIWYWYDQFVGAMVLKKILYVCSMKTLRLFTTMTASLLLIMFSHLFLNYGRFILNSIWIFHPWLCLHCIISGCQFDTGIRSSRSCHFDTKKCTLKLYC